MTIWNSSVLDGVIVQANSYGLTVKFHKRLDNKDFHLTNIYGPSVSSEKLAFITWLINLDTSTFDEWILAGDFNLIISAENRSKSVVILLKCKCSMTVSLGWIL